MLLTLLIATLAGCGGSSSEPPEATPVPPVAQTSAEPGDDGSSEGEAADPIDAAAAAEAADPDEAVDPTDLAAGGSSDLGERKGRRVRRNLGGEPGLVVFVVMDTVRSDHTSLCGYERPTTPTLLSLKRSGASFTCDAYSPAPWTLPSHASFFTGTSVTEHATMFVANSDVEINSTITARPLDDRFETLAETFKARGYQTAMVSANSILNEPSGLQQGFDHVDISHNGLSMRARGLGLTLRTRLEALDPDKPLFLFVNLYDAHDPYPAIPEGVPWAPAQPRAVLDAYTAEPDNPYYAFIKGLMPEEERPAFLTALTNGYDMGVSHADANVAVTLGILMRSGFMMNGYRMVITSDHGEFLGEHQLLRHSGFLWEPGVKVPLMFLDSTRRRQPRMKGPISAIHAYHLARDGHLPRTRIPPHAVSEKNPEDILVGTIAGALWDGKDKAMCIDGVNQRYDLFADPDESNPLDVANHRLTPKLTDLCGRVDALHELPPPEGGAELREALKAVGYVE